MSAFAQTAWFRGSRASAPTAFPPFPVNPKLKLVVDQLQEEGLLHEWIGAFRFDQSNPGGIPVPTSGLFHRAIRGIGFIH